MGSWRRRGQSESPVLAPISQCTGAKDQKMPG
ncbi:hypothetical protein FOXG_19194 [Fusarium oxysporum f. sp. lycopersici 4287]|uniref:Uncharacterized protein n=2 Tax=Fusarium oxysporum TaxID=5507 RepID=A0A0J9UX93_FUSO4|nr:hypothetical protein FOXG_19194 [Fusarium oxysporum f. sp. lycopersici 4287]EXK33348.1 hypothetical protein FOMG_12052 [Fusarium oxysporum f. sp. melonis 26406]KNB03770.1 hypothetical protein FOXG_19194 [Fusarium oxysporum f. sp. lycopersici 4287]